jgi:incFII family plasmid replication initiator RepA
VEWENKQRKKQSLPQLGMDELIAKSWRFVRERFAAIRLSVNLMARSEQPRGGMLRANGRTSRRVFVSS